MGRVHACHVCARPRLGAHGLSHAAPSAGNAALPAAAASMRARLAALLDRRLLTTPSQRASLVYDTTWGGLIGFGDAATGAENNCGNRAYSDHHFHYGYLLQAAAAVGRGNPAWLAARRDAVLAVLRDFANPRRDDPAFPFARMMDWWVTWHSGACPAASDVGTACCCCCCCSCCEHRGGESPYVRGGGLCVKSWLTLCCCPFIANPRWGGHSWTSGILMFGDGKNQVRHSEPTRPSAPVPTPPHSPPPHV
jgi:hypothetical protein